MLKKIQQKQNASYDAFYEQPLWPVFPIEYKKRSIGYLHSGRYFWTHLIANGDHTDTLDLFQGSLGRLERHQRADDSTQKWRFT